MARLSSAAIKRVLRGAFVLARVALALTLLSLLGAEAMWYYDQSPRLSSGFGMVVVLASSAVALTRRQGLQRLAKHRWLMAIRSLLSWNLMLNLALYATVVVSPSRGGAVVRHFVVHSTSVTQDAVSFPLIASFVMLILFSPTAESLDALLLRQEAR